MSSLPPLPTLTLSYWIRRWFLFNLKRINMQPNSEVKALSSLSSAHIGILPLTPSNRLLPDWSFQKQALIVASSSNTSPFKTLQELFLSYERRNCFNSAAWDSKPSIIWYWLYSDFHFPAWWYWGFQMDYIIIHWRCHVLYDQDFDHLSQSPIQNAFSKPVQMLPHLKHVLTSLGPPAQSSWFIW